MSTGYALTGRQIIQDVSEPSDDEVPDLASSAHSDTDDGDSDGSTAAPHPHPEAAAKPAHPARSGRGAPTASRGQQQRVETHQMGVVTSSRATDDGPPGLVDGDDGMPGLLAGSDGGGGSISSEADDSQVSSDEEQEEGQQAAAAVGAAAADADEDDEGAPDMVSVAGSQSDSGVEHDYARGKRYNAAREPPPPRAAATRRRKQQAGGQQPKAAKAAAKTAAAATDMPGLVSDAHTDADQSDPEDERQQRRAAAAAGGAAGPYYDGESDDELGGRGAAGGKGKRRQQQAAGGLKSGFFDQGKATPGGKSQYAGAGVGAREDLRGQRKQPPGAHSTAQQQQHQQQQQQQQKQRRKPAPAPATAERVVAEVARDEELQAAIRLEEQERKELRKRLGLDEDEEAEVEDPELGQCTFGSQCTRDAGDHRVKSSHADRYEIRCSAGHRLFYHTPCWRKASVRTEANGKEQQVVGKDYKWPKKTERRKCVDPECDGIVMFIEGANKYPILNIEEEVKKELGGVGAVDAAEVPEWERYRSQNPKERRFKFKKGTGKRADEDDDEEEAPHAAGASRASYHEEWQEEATGEEEQQEPEAEASGSADHAAGTSAAAGAAEEAPPQQQAHVLPDDQMLRALRRESSEEHMLGGTGRKARGKDKGRAAGNAEIMYEDNKPDKRKKKGVRMILDSGLSIAEQRRQREPQADSVFYDTPMDHGYTQPPQNLGLNVMDFPDLEEAALLARAQPEDAERAARELYSSALLSALRSYKAGEFRPDDPHGPAVVLVEKLDYRRIRDEEGARPEMYLRSSFAEFGPLKDMRTYEACKAALVTYRSTAAAYKAYMLLSQRVLLHHRLTAMLLERMPTEAEVEARAAQLQEEAQRRAEGWGSEEDEEQQQEEEEDEQQQLEAIRSGVAGAAAAAAAASAAMARAPLYATGLPGVGGSQPVSIFGRGAAGGGGGGTSSSYGAAAFGGPGDGSVPNNLKVSAREFVPGSSTGGSLSPGASPAPAGGGELGGSTAGDYGTTTGFQVASSAAAAAVAAPTPPLSGLGPAAAAGAAAGSLANGGLRVAASVFKPTPGAASAAQQPEAEAEGEGAGVEEEEQEEEQQQADPLTSKFLSGQMIATNKANYRAYLAYQGNSFGLPISCLEKVGLFSKDQIALLMCDIEEGCLYGVWGAQEKLSTPQAGEVVAFKQERILPPLPLEAVSSVLQWQNGGVKVPQKLPAASVHFIMQAFVDHEQEQHKQRQAAVAAAAAAAAAARAAAPRPTAQGGSAATSRTASVTSVGSGGGRPSSSSPAAMPPHLAAQRAPAAAAAPRQQQQQQPSQDEWWREDERRRREQEQQDAELARQLQEQLLAEAQLEERRRLQEDARMAAALHRSSGGATSGSGGGGGAGPGGAPAMPRIGSSSGGNGGGGGGGAAPFGYAAAAAARPAMPPPAPSVAAAVAGAAGPTSRPAPPPLGPGSILSSLFPGMRPPGSAPGAGPGAAAPAAAGGGAAPAALRVPSPGAGVGPAPRPYRPAIGGYRLSMARPPAAAPAAAPSAAPAAPSPPAAAAAATAAPVPAAAAAPAVAAPAAAAPAPAAQAAAVPPAAAGQAAAPAPAALANPCVQCKQRESVHIWIPCGHHGHCQVCLADSLPLPQKLAQFPHCLRCNLKAQYYIRMYS